MVGLLLNTLLCVHSPEVESREKDVILRLLRSDLSRSLSHPATLPDIQRFGPTRSSLDIIDEIEKALQELCKA